MRGGDPSFLFFKKSCIAVFPACAGVILDNLDIPNPTFGFPRMRGGDPEIPFRQRGFYRFSPHARG